MTKRILLAIIALFSLSNMVSGQDRLFNYVYQSLVLNKGQKELEIWTTVRTGREDYYRRIDSRAEFEVGLSRKVQTAFYLNYSSRASEMMEDSVLVMDTENEFSFSNEWKWKLSDPVANVIGSALYGEITFSPSEFEIETKIILDKKIGKVTQALNLVFEPEWEWEAEDGEIQSETEYKFEFNYGIGVSLGKGFAVGAEIRNPNIYVDDAWSHSALFAGPTLSYFRNDFWVNLTFMPQVAGLRGISANTSLNLDEFERYQARLIFSYAF